MTEETPSFPGGPAVSAEGNPQEATVSPRRPPLAQEAPLCLTKETPRRPLSVQGSPSSPGGPLCLPKEAPKRPLSVQGILLFLRRPPICPRKPPV